MTRQSSFELLPGVVLFRVFDFLNPNEISRCVVLSQSFARWFKDPDESTPFFVRVLHDEGLEGGTYEDWVAQMRAWYEYRGELRSTLCSLAALGSKKEGEDGKTQQRSLLSTLGAALHLMKDPIKLEKEKCRDCLAEKIANFTHRVANSHSWYKHLPVTSGEAQFDFGVNLCSRLRYVNGQWIDYVRGDGTEFHYTWSTTEAYRRRFGYFVYYETYPDNARTPRSSIVTAPWDIGSVGANSKVRVPKSCRAPSVRVTSALHGSCTSYALYELILNEAKTTGSDLLESPIEESALQWCSQRNFVEGGLLPTSAATDLNLFAALLSEEPHSMRLSEVGAQVLAGAYPDIPKICSASELATDILSSAGDVTRGLATVALVAQHWRELLAIGESLLQCCSHAYGRDVTPAASIVQENIISQDMQQRRLQHALL